MPLLIVNFLQLLLTALMVVVSWVAPMGGGGLVAFIYQATEPLLAPIRRLLPPTGGLDFSPMVAILLLGLLMRLVAQL